MVKFVSIKKINDFIFGVHGLCYYKNREVMIVGLTSDQLNEYETETRSGTTYFNTFFPTVKEVCKYFDDKGISYEKPNPETLKKGLQI